MNPADSPKPTAAEALDIAHELNKILDCGLDKESLSICIALLESGVNPEALAEVVKRLRKEAARAKQARETGHQ
jgi:mitotic-spindle organizing protein 1